MSNLHVAAQSACESIGVIYQDRPMSGSTLFDGYVSRQSDVFCKVKKRGEHLCTHLTLNVPEINQLSVGDAFDFPCHESSERIAV